MAIKANAGGGKTTTTTKSTSSGNIFSTIKNWLSGGSSSSKSSSTSNNSVGTNSSAGISANKAATTKESALSSNIGTTSSGGISGSKSNNASTKTVTTGGTGSVTVNKNANTSMAGNSYSAALANAAKNNTTSNTIKASTGSTGTGSTLGTGTTTHVASSGTTHGGGGSNRFGNTDLSTMTTAEKSATLTSYGIPLVYTEEKQQEILNGMTEKGITNYSDYKNIETMDNLMKNSSILGTGKTAQDEEIKTALLEGDLDKLKELGVTSTVVDDDATDYYNGGSGNGDAAEVVSDAQSYYDDLMAAFMEQNEEAREAALEAILQNLDAVKGTYKSQIQDVIDEYDQLVNENEVKKDRARRAIRENQANRGQLDSGMGRQELLDMNIGYDNITTNLKSAREKAVAEIYNLIAQAEAEANTNKASVNNTYNNALLEYQLANQ